VILLSGFGRTPRVESRRHPQREYKEGPLRCLWGKLMLGASFDARVSSFFFRSALYVKENCSVRTANKGGVKMFSPTRLQWDHLDACGANSCPAPALTAKLCVVHRTSRTAPSPSPSPSHPRDALVAASNNGCEGRIERKKNSPAAEPVEKCQPKIHTRKRDVDHEYINRISGRTHSMRGIHDNSVCGRRREVMHGWWMSLIVGMDCDIPPFVGGPKKISRKFKNNRNETVSLQRRSREENCSDHASICKGCESR
jgi:hypothetical protein